MKQSPQPSSRRKPVALALASAALGTVMALSAAEWALGVYADSLQSESMEPGLLRYHARLGWSLSPGWQGSHRHHDFLAHYSIDAGGFRGAPGAFTSAPARTVAVLGDSFTFGLGVNDEETFVARLNDRLGPATRLVNHGVPGTSTDQQLLLLRDLLRRDVPDQVVLTVYLANDILDNTLDYPLQADQAKPYFVVENGRLVLRNTPVPRQAKPAALRERTLASILLEGYEPADTPAPYWSRFHLGRLVTGAFETRGIEPGELQAAFEANLGDALELFAALLDAFVNDLSVQGAELGVVLLPGREAVLGRDGVSQAYQDYLRNRLKETLDRKEIEFLDLLEAFGGVPEGTAANLFYPYDGHLTRDGHALAADYLAAWDFLN